MDESFYKNLLDVMADGVYFVDRERKITFWNKSAERITGYTTKKILGRSCADNILRHVDEFWNVLGGAVRAQDTPCRWGGEEFVVICHDISADGLKALGERIRMLIEKSWLDHHGKRIFVTASIGGTLSRHGKSLEEVVNRGGQELYRSKAEGRNVKSLLR